MIKTVLFLAFTFAMFIHSVAARLVVIRFITIQDEPAIILKSKFKFTEVFTTAQTIQALNTPKNNTFASIQDIPNVPVKNQGVIDKKYFRVNNTGIYVTNQHMDVQQFQQMRDSYKPRPHEVVVVNSPQMEHVNLQENYQYCYIRQNFNQTTGQQRIDIISELCQPQMESAIMSRKGEEKVEEQEKNSSHFEQIAVSSGILAIFTAAKAFYVSYKLKRQSIV